MKFFAGLRRPGGMRAQMSSGPSTPWGGFWISPEGFLLGGDATGISSDRSLTLPAWWKATRVVTETIASLQLTVHERLGEGRGDRPLPEHPLTWSLGYQPSPSTDAFGHWETTILHLIHRGNAYAFKRYIPTPRGLSVQLDIIHPDRVRVERRPSGALDYQVKNDRGQYESYSQANIFHVRGMGPDGIRGFDMVQCATASVQGALAAENYAHRFFKQGAMAGVAAIPEQDIGEEGMKNLLASVQSYLTGLENAHGVFVPPDKITLQTLGYDAEKAQILLTRQFTTEQVAHWFNLPPGIIGDAKTPTFASSQQFRQDLVDLCFRPLAERIEKRIDVEILRDADADNPLHYFSRFDLDKLLRGNESERSMIHQRNILAGWETRNEARLDEDLEPIDGLDDPVLPVNVGGASSSGMAPGMGAQRLVSMREATFILQESTRLVRKEVAAATKAAQRHANDAPGWQAWVKEFYGQHASEISERLHVPPPVAKEYAARQGLRLSSRGVGTIEQWEATVVAELADLAVAPCLEQVVNRLEEQAA